LRKKNRAGNHARIEPRAQTPKKKSRKKKQKKPLIETGKKKWGMGEKTNHQPSSPGITPKQKLKKKKKGLLNSNRTNQKPNALVPLDSNTVRPPRPPASWGKSPSSEVHLTHLESTQKDICVHPGPCYSVNREKTPPGLNLRHAGKVVAQITRYSKVYGRRVFFLDCRKKKLKWGARRAREASGGPLATKNVAPQNGRGGEWVRKKPGLGKKFGVQSLGVSSEGSWV